MAQQNPQEPDIDLVLYPSGTAAAFATTGAGTDRKTIFCSGPHETIAAAINHLKQQIPKDYHEANSSLRYPRLPD